MAKHGLTKADAFARRLAKPLGVMVRALYRFTFLAFLALIQLGCGTCKTTLIDTKSQGEWSADLEFRVCGSVSGFGVSVYRSEDGPLKSGEGGLEPFLSTYKEQRNIPPDTVPVEITWIGEEQLKIKHETRAGLEDSSTDLMTRKAKSRYETVSITYNPKPVIWE